MEISKSDHPPLESTMEEASQDGVSIGQAIEIPLSPLDDGENPSMDSHYDSRNYSNDRNSNLANDTNSSSSQSTNCYCGKERNLGLIELQCAKCSKWFHHKCISVQTGRLLPFLMNYTFLCKDCNSGNEIFTRRQTNFIQMCETAIANLMHRTGKNAFARDKEIIPFIETKWDLLTTMPRRITQTWHNTIGKTMIKEHVFVSDQTEPKDPLFGLRCGDLEKIGPNADPSMKGGIGDFGANETASSTGQPNTVTPGRGGFGRWGKRRGVGLSQLEGSEYVASKRAKSDLSNPKLPPSGFPKEYPFNKDGYRYILAEADPHAPCRQEFEDSADCAGKPIPGWLCRKLLHDKVLIALHDRAPQLKISEDRLSVTGEKGYCMVRASHGVMRGRWYYEIDIVDMPDGAATRLGWAQELANLQAPLGYDKFGYSWRSRKGTKFHESKGQHYADTGYSEGDTIGFLIDLPQQESRRPSGVGPTLSDYLGHTHKEKQLIRFRGYLYFEEKDESQQQLKKLRPLPGSRIICYKNGTEAGAAWTDVYAGTYYPTASLYKSVNVRFNFGPNFRYPPPVENVGAYKAISELGEDAQVEQAMADIMYLTENEDKLTLDHFYGLA